MIMKRFYSYESALALAMVASVLGHCFSPFLRFRGGKGVATVAGSLFFCLPYFTLINFVFFVTVVAFSGFVSLGSIMTMFAGALYGFFLLNVSLDLRVAIVFVAFISIFQHRSNIKRLMAGTEASFKEKKND